MLNSLWPMNVEDVALTYRSSSRHAPNGLACADSAWLSCASADGRKPLAQLKLAWRSPTTPPQKSYSPAAI
jgi:hypothetical protein